MNISRIPALVDSSPDGMLVWFAEMSVRDLLFHPDDDPVSIVGAASGARTFSDNEVNELRDVVATLFEKHGDSVYEAAYPIAMNACGIRLDS